MARTLVRARTNYQASTLRGRHGSADAHGRLVADKRKVAVDRLTPVTGLTATVRDVSAAPQPTTDTVVMKFGGSSGADPDEIHHVAMDITTLGRGGTDATAVALAAALDAVRVKKGRILRVDLEMTRASSRRGC